MEKNKGRTALQIGIITVAVGFIAIGILLGEHWEVFVKAVRICLECIGLG